MDTKETINCCRMLADIVNLQDEAVQVLAKVVGTPIQEDPDAIELCGSLGVVEMNLHAVERKMRLLVRMLNDLHDRV